MANFRYIVDNHPLGLLGDGVGYSTGYNKLAHQSCTITCDSVDADFPLANLINKIPSKPMLFDTETGNVNIFIDFGTSTYCDFIGIIGHNIPAAGSSVYLKSGSNSIVTKDVVTTQVTGYNLGEMYTEFTARTSQYWKIEFTGVTNCFIGELILGRLKIMTQNFSWNFNHTYAYKNLTNETEYGQSYSYHLNRIRSLDGLAFKDISDTTADEIIDMIEATKGSHLPILVVWEDTPVYNSIYGKLKDQFKRNIDFINLNSITGLSVEGLPFAKSIYALT